MSASFVAFLAVGIGRTFVDLEASARLEKILDWMAGLLLLLTVGLAAVAVVSFLVAGAETMTGTPNPKEK